MTENRQSGEEKPEQTCNNDALELRQALLTVAAEQAWPGMVDPGDSDKDENQGK